MLSAASTRPNYYLQEHAGGEAEPKESAPHLSGCSPITLIQMNTD